MWGSSQRAAVREIGDELVAKAYQEPLTNADWNRLNEAARGDADAYGDVTEVSSRIGRASDVRRGVRH